MRKMRLRLVFSTFLSCSQNVRRVLSQCNTRLRLLYLLNISRTMENGLPFSMFYSRPDAFRHLPSSVALTYSHYRVFIG